jgi:tetratricopeptide (TPR) repeat protein
LSKLVAEQAFLLTFRGMPKDAIASAQAVIAQAHRVGDSESELAGYLDWGLQEYYLGNLDAAQSILEKALSLARALADVDRAAELDAASSRRRLLLEAQAMRYVAALRVVQGRDEEAHALGQETVRVYRLLHHLWGEARTMIFLGDSYTIAADYPKAREYYEHGLDICLSMEHTYGQCHMHIELCRIATFLSDFALAKQHGERAWMLVRDLGNARFRAYAMAALSDCAHRSGEHHLAYSYAQEAVNVIQPASYPGIYAYCLDRLGDALTDLGRLAEAAEAYQDGLSIRREQNSLALVVMSLANNARLALLRGEIVQARVYAGEALELVSTKGLLGAPEPWRIYFDLHRALSATDDDRVNQMLERANALLQNQATKIADVRLRRSFLEDVAIHREITTAYAHIHAATQT